MSIKEKYSIIYPDINGVEYKKLSGNAFHDLSLDKLCEKLSDNQKEIHMIKDVISLMTADSRVAQYRAGVFSDILRFPGLRECMAELFDKFEFIRNYGIHHLNTDEKLGVWHLFRRMDELGDYISCVEAMQKCLGENEIESEGLKGFREYVDTLYHKANFGEMKADIEALKIEASEVKSVTVGINVNERFEATELGLVSINNKPFKKSGVVSNLADAISQKRKIQDGTEWDGNMHFHPVEMSSKGDGALVEAVNKQGKIKLETYNGLFGGSMESGTMLKIAQGDGMANSTFYLSNVVSRMLDQMVRRLRDVLDKYADVVVMNISHIIPEFVYYIRFAEFIEKNIKNGYSFCAPEIIAEENTQMTANGFYNLKLVLSGVKNEDIVTNNLIFDKEHTVYILTGANRGGKTTVTQAVGIMYVLAQGGIYVPGMSFSYKPVDCVYTHFPADEDKTLDLGRLGEECIRFKENYNLCTENSLYLLNESFSSTSFEEGYYIAVDSVKALLKKSVRTIFNTHMHKLGEAAAELNDGKYSVGASSVIVRSDGGKRSFKIEVAPPEGLSYARDIAEKYGVTYEMLTKEV